MNDLDYLELVPIADTTLKMEIPINSKAIRHLITKKEIEKIIGNMPTIEIIDAEEKQIEQEYKKLLNKGTNEDLIRIIKTTYLRNKARIEKKKKASDKDSHYFEEAEKALYQEFGTVLGLTVEETKKYVLDKLK